jgi:hypothetical protein
MIQTFEIHDRIQQEARKPNSQPATILASAHSPTACKNHLAEVCVTEAFSRLSFASLFLHQPIDK